MALTKKDLQQIDERIEIRLEQQRELIKQDTEDLLFKYKSELIDQIDPILKEVKVERKLNIITT